MLFILLLISIIGTGVALFFTVLEMFASWRDWYDVRRYAVRMLIFIGIGIISILGLAGIYALSYEEESETGNWELVAITDDTRTSGKASGGPFYIQMSVDTDDVYSFYYKVEDDGFKRGTLKADSTTIYEEDNCTPHIVRYTTYTKNKMNGILRGILALEFGTSEEQSYKIYIPKGTILKYYSLDNTQ